MGILAKPWRGLNDRDLTSDIEVDAASVLEMFRRAVAKRPDATQAEAYSELISSNSDMGVAKFAQIVASNARDLPATRFLAE